MAASGKKRPARPQPWRRLCRAVGLALFLLLLYRATEGGLGPLPADAFLRLDPLLGLALPLAAREWLPQLLPAGLVILSAAVLGRVFCGWICPMGASLDAFRTLFRLRRAAVPKDSLHRMRRIKYALLAGVLAGALFSVNLAFWLSPIPLVTRLWAILLFPLGQAGAEGVLALGLPLLEALGPDSLRYWHLDSRHYAGMGFVALLWAALFGLELLRPRFWCRYLCPAGALLGLLAGLGPWRRVRPSCPGCGRCASACPAGILAGDGHGLEIVEGIPEGAGRSAAHADPERFFAAAECLACRSCSAVCPQGAVSFGWKAGSAGQSSGTLPGRRAVVASVASGALLAGVCSRDVSALGNAWQGQVLRPPASLPEAEFLQRCVRCGACMQACPTNALHPVWLESGLSGMFSPQALTRVGPCEPECTACGRVCPTGAIRPLALEQKKWAKMGTALVMPGRCLAWAEGRRCMVCQETCPYAAIRLVQEAGMAAPAPVVMPERCFGCGYCEKHCPTQVAAIRVEPLGALRLEGGDYREAALRFGLDLDPALRQNTTDDMSGSDGPPPGFLD